MWVLFFSVLKTDLETSWSLLALRALRARLAPLVLALALPRLPLPGCLTSTAGTHMEKAWLVTNAHTHTQTERGH